MKQEILSNIPLVWTGQLINAEKMQVQNPATGAKGEVFTEADSNKYNN